MGNFVPSWQWWRYDPTVDEILKRFPLSVPKLLFLFLPVYALAVAADWFQGPYLYALYKYEKGLPEQTVARLYATGFIAGGISALFAGSLADHYGRKKGCLAYCGLSCISSLATVSNRLCLLVLGRILGGMATTLLFSVFEAWLVSEYHRCKVNKDGRHPHPGHILAKMGIVSGSITTLSGFFTDLLVCRFGTLTAPFICSSMSAALAGLLIACLWPENAGHQGKPRLRLSDLVPDWSRLTDRRVLVLGLVTTVFEGAMYLFIFFWPAAMQAAHTSAGKDGRPDFGLIFSNFMLAMTVGSFIGAALLSELDSIDGILFTMQLACLTLSGSSLTEHEHLLWCHFCLLELCIGAYFPIMGYLKSSIIKDDARRSIYATLRVPLNLFVVFLHSQDREGSWHRNLLFVILAGLLLIASWVCKRNMKVRNRQGREQMRLKN